ncbi:hypothetical protein [Streptomyces sp. Inha503]|uniref:hypothetical protein n=1 Tax=Streptomyces sp. Inha503 TaxID=3383314 RepID=UPI00399FCDA9
MGSWTRSSCRFGQRPQDRRLVLGLHDPQIMAEQGDLGDVARVVRVGLSVAAGGQEPGPGRQREGHVHHVLARGGQPPREGAAQAAGAGVSDVDAAECAQQRAQATG